LAAELADRIARLGPIPFSDYMATVLYDPSRGYYARHARQVGRGGDFFTSVSVGPLFGRLLAHRFVNWWLEAGSPPAWRIVECGAHDGTLAGDVLTALKLECPAAFKSLEYIIREPLPELADAQRAKLASFSNVAILRNASDLKPKPGITFGNELLDALPFDVVQRIDGSWKLLEVDALNDRFQWSLGGLYESDDASLKGTFPEGYRTEVRRGYQEFLAPLGGLMTDGSLFLWIDYGFARPEYLAPERVTGTLRTFSNHRAGEDPFEKPGEIDITAHVDFTSVAEAGLGLGAVPTEFTNQGSWLTKLAGPWLASQDGNPDPVLIRQFQTLTHPGHLGSRFHVLEMTVGAEPSGELQPQVFSRLAL
jgi:SAM-dependent MidA family methyltransferase